jgi:hypothetical protein
MSLVRCFLFLCSDSRIWSGLKRARSLLLRNDRTGPPCKPVVGLDEAYGIPLHGRHDRRTAGSDSLSDVAWGTFVVLYG